MKERAQRSEVWLNRLGSLRLGGPYASSPESFADIVGLGRTTVTVI